MLCSSNVSNKSNWVFIEFHSGKGRSIKKCDFCKLHIGHNPTMLDIKKKIESVMRSPDKISVSPAASMLYGISILYGAVQKLRASCYRAKGIAFQKTSVPGDFGRHTLRWAEPEKHP